MHADAVIPTSSTPSKTNMKKHILGNVIRGFLVVIVVSFFGASAIAGPGPMQTYVPVKTMKQAAAIKPGEKVAITCGKCGGVTTFTVGEDRSFLQGFVCPNCKTKFVSRVNPHGGAIGSFEYDDDDGHVSRLALMH